MSDIAGAVRAGTAQLAGAASDVARMRRVSAAQKDAATSQKMEDAGRAIGEAFKRHQSMREAKEEEDDLLELEKADALGRATGDPGKRIATLRAIQPKTLRSAMMRATKLNEAMGAAEQYNEKLMKDAEAKLEFDHKQRVQAEVERHNRETERRLSQPDPPKPPTPTDPNDVPLAPEVVQQMFARYGITNASPMGWSANLLAKVGLKFEPPESKDEPKPTAWRPQTREEAEAWESFKASLNKRAAGENAKKPGLDPMLKARIDELQKRRTESANMFDAASVAEATRQIDELMAGAGATGGGNASEAGPKAPSEMSEEEIIRELMGK